MSRVSKVVDTMSSISRPQVFTDDYVAELIAREVKSSNKFSSLDKASPLPTARNNINKNFLQNTIKGVESHNRREEIDECWRQHSLDKMLSKKRRLDYHASNEDSNRDIQEREYWAKRKEEKSRTSLTSFSPHTLNCTPILDKTNPDNSEANDSSDSESNSSSDNDSEKETKLSHKKSRDKEDKDKKHHKRKHKKGHKKDRKKKHRKLDK